MLVETSSAADFCCRFLAQKQTAVSKTTTITAATTAAATTTATTAAGTTAAETTAATTAETTTAPSSTSDTVDADQTSSQTEAVPQSKVGNDDVATTTKTTTTTTTTTKTITLTLDAISAEQLATFKAALTELLLEKCRSSNWDLRFPLMGNAYRALSCFAPNSNVDPVFVNAAKASHIHPNVLKGCLPKDFVIWIDPGSVSYRVGDYGNIITLVDQGRVIAPTSAPPPMTAAVKVSSGASIPHGMATSYGHTINPYLVNDVATENAQTLAASAWQQHLAHGRSQESHVQLHKLGATTSFGPSGVFRSPAVVPVRITSPSATPPPQVKRPAYVVVN